MIVDTTTHFPDDDDNDGAPPDQMTRERFIALTGQNQWATVDEFVRALDAGDYWPANFIEHALEIAKKHHVRRMARTVRDETGFPVLASVVTRDESGQAVRIYKQETLFNLDDYRQVVQYHKDRGLHHIHMANTYATRSNNRFDDQLPLPFPGTQATD